MRVLIDHPLHLVQVRDLAEQRVATPDFGLSQTFSVQERRTATEINAIGQMFHQSSDLRLRVFRMASISFIG